MELLKPGRQKLDPFVKAMKVIQLKTPVKLEKLATLVTFAKLKKPEARTAQAQDLISQTHMEYVKLQCLQKKICKWVPVHKFLKIWIIFLQTRNSNFIFMDVIYKVQVFQFTEKAWWYVFQYFFILNVNTLYVTTSKSMGGRIGAFKLTWFVIDGNCDQLCDHSTN